MNSGGGGGGSGGGGMFGQIGGVVGGMIGADAASGDRSKAQGYVENAYNELLSLGLPPDLSKEILYQKFQEAGVLTPQMEQAIEQTHSQAGQMQENPAMRNAQIGALTQLQQLGKTGLGAEDRAALSEIRDQTQRDLEGKRQQIMQNMQQRGMGGSGAELISQLQASQSGANSANKAGLQIGAQAQQRALQALMNSSNLAGNIRQTDYGQDLNRAQAQDELNRFNTTNQMSRQQRNIASQNQAQATNLQNKQGISNANVNMGNQEQLRQANAQRQYWQDLADRASLRSGAMKGLGGEYQRRGDAKAGQEQAKYTGIGMAGDAASDDFKSMIPAAASMFSDEKLKKNVKSGDKDIKEFLDSAKPFSYEFKANSEKNTSPMAQNLEKSKIGKEAVSDTDAGKSVDYGKILGKIVASQGYIHEQLEKMKNESSKKKEKK